jgi:multicomponent Na+:H+ antiporter subunit B
MTLSSDVLIDISLLGLLCITGIAVVRCRNLLTATILLGIFSLLMASMYLALSAPDVAITEAAVGAGISTILLLLVLTITGKEEKTPQGNPILPFLVVLATGAGLIYATKGMPSIGDANAPANQHVASHYINESYHEIGIPNMVTSVLASYRGFDTLGETFVIFTAAISVLLLIGQRKSG